MEEKYSKKFGVKEFIGAESPRRRSTLGVSAMYFVWICFTNTKHSRNWLSARLGVKYATSKTLNMAHMFCAMVGARAIPLIALMMLDGLQ